MQKWNIRNAHPEVVRALVNADIGEYRLDFDAIKLTDPLDLHLPEFQTDPIIRARSARLKRVWVTSDPLPGGHFSSYFGLFGLRSYSNPVIGSLYATHEMTHMDEFPYAKKGGARLPFADWARAMLRGEFVASVESECLVYYRIAGLRQRTFAHEIWVDRFLKRQKGTFTTPNSKDYKAFVKKITTKRERAMNNPTFDDVLELQLSHYRLTNYGWDALYAQPVGYGKYADEPAFRVIENHMRMLRESKLSDNAAHENHLQWLRDVTPEFGSVQIPFAYHAVKYLPSYKTMVEHYGNGIYLS